MMYIFVKVAYDQVYLVGLEEEIIYNEGFWHDVEARPIEFNFFLADLTTETVDA